MLSFRDDADHLRELGQFIAIPSVSRDSQPETMRAAAEWLAAKLSFASAEILETEGNPVVTATLAGPKESPTVLVYGHYDVQPTGDLGEWLSPPFELTREDGIVRGRGATDDKGPVYIVLQVARAFAEQEGGAPLNVKFVFEGEEEIGSPNFPAFLRKQAQRFACDLVISADGAMWRHGEPSVSVGSKGLVSLDVSVEGAASDLHSGRYGGTVANPLHALAALLAGLHQEDGRVAVEGFYDGIPELSPERRAEIARIPFSDDEYCRQLGVGRLFGEASYTTLERLWERPTLEINGISGGGRYTVIPHRAEAHITCRLVPGQRPEEVLRAITSQLERARPDGVRLRVVGEPGAVAAYTITPDHPAVGAATAALQRVYPGQDVVLAKIGGTLPATVLFEEVLGAKTLFFSFSTSDEKLHAPNEYLRVPRLREGMVAWETLWRLLADGPHRLGRS